MRLIVFDVDGTLVDSQAHILASLGAAFASVGRPAPSREEALAIVGLSLPVAMRTLAPDAADTEADAMVAAYKEAFHDARVSGAPSPLYPGTRALLDALAARDDLVLGVATGKSRRGLDHVFAVHGLAPYFATQQVADDHPSKPHPAMLLAAMAETGMDPRATVMVGDTEFDIAMGRAAGARTVGVTWGYHPADRLSGADALAGDWAAVAAFIGGQGA